MAPNKRIAAPTLEELYACKPSVLWRWFKAEHISFWLCCGYLFFEYVRPQSIYPSIAFLPWSTLLAVGAFAAGFADKLPKPSSNALSKLMLTYGAIVLLSSAFAVYPNVAFSSLRDYFDWLVIYFAIVRVVHTKERFFVFCLLYMLVNFKMSQHGFISWARNGFRFDRDGVIGGPGWFHNSGEFGIQLCIFTPMVFAFIMALRQYWGNITKLFFYLMPLTALGSNVASSSRGALIGLFASGFWSLKASKYFVRTVVLMVIAISILYQFVPAESKARFQNSGNDYTSIHRLDRWKQGWGVMKEYPILGLGHNNWSDYFNNHLDTTTVPGPALVHNIFVQCGTELGFTGVFVLTALFVYMLILDSRVRKKAKETGDKFSYYMAHGMDGAVIGLIISSCFITVLYYPYIWLHAAFISCLYNTVCKDGNGRKGRRSAATLPDAPAPQI